MRTWYSTTLQHTRKSMEVLEKKENDCKWKVSGRARDNVEKFPPINQFFLHLRHPRFSLLSMNETRFNQNDSGSIFYWLHCFIPGAGVYWKIFCRFYDFSIQCCDKVNEIINFIIQFHISRQEFHPHNLHFNDASANRDVHEGNQGDCRWAAVRRFNKILKFLLWI